MKNLLFLGTILFCVLFTIGCSNEDSNTNVEITNEEEVTVDDINEKEDDLKFYLPERMYVVTKNVLETYCDTINNSDEKSRIELGGSLSVYTKTIKVNIENMNKFYPNDPYAKELSSLMKPCIEALDKILNQVEGYEEITDKELTDCVTIIHETEDIIDNKISELSIDESIVDYK